MFTALRGGMFMCSLSRLNKRIRHMLFQNLLKQEIIFFEENKPGDAQDRNNPDPEDADDVLFKEILLKLKYRSGSFLIAAL